MTQQRNAGQPVVDDDGSSDIEHAVDHNLPVFQIKNDSVSVDTLKPGDVVYARQFMWAYTQKTARRSSRQQLRPIEARAVCIVLCVNTCARVNAADSTDSGAWTCKQDTVDVMLATAGNQQPLWVRILDGAYAAVFTRRQHYKLKMLL